MIFSTYTIVYAYVGDSRLHLKLRINNQRCASKGKGNLERSREWDLNESLPLISSQNRFKSPIILNLVRPFSLSVVQIQLSFTPSGFLLFISLVTLQLHR